MIQPTERKPQRFRFRVSGEFYAGACLPTTQTDGSAGWVLVTEDDRELFDSDPWEVLGQCCIAADRLEWIDNDHGWHDYTAADHGPEQEEPVEEPPGRKCVRCSASLDPGFCYSSCLRCQAGKCEHGSKLGDCNECDIASDRAYDESRER